MLMAVVANAVVVVVNHVVRDALHLVKEHVKTSVVLDVMPTAPLDVYLNAQWHALKIVYQDAVMIALMDAVTIVKEIVHLTVMEAVLLDALKHVKMHVHHALEHVLKLV